MSETCGTCKWNRGRCSNSDCIYYGTLVTDIVFNTCPICGNEESCPQWGADDDN
jgi:hypothetical protein